MHEIYFVASPLARELPVGAIAGGVSGAVVVILGVIVLLLLIRRYCYMYW